MQVFTPLGLVVHTGVGAGDGVVVEEELVELVPVVDVVVPEVDVVLFCDEVVLAT